MDLDDDELAEQSLLAVNNQLEGAETQGEVTEILNFAASYSSLLEATIGRVQVRRFEVVNPTLHNIFIQQVGQEANDA